MASALALPVFSLLHQRATHQWCALPKRRISLMPLRATKLLDSAHQPPDPQPPSNDIKSAVLAASVFSAPAIFFVNEAFAIDGEFGLLEGRTASLVHPALMLLLFASTCYTGWLGWQWRRTRELGNEIRELKKQLPAVAEDGTRPASPVAAMIEEAEAVGVRIRMMVTFRGITSCQKRLYLLLSSEGLRIASWWRNTDFSPVLVALLSRLDRLVAQFAVPRFEDLH